MAGSVEDILAVCHSPGVLRAATVSLVGSKKGVSKLCEVGGRGGVQCRGSPSHEGQKSSVVSGGSGTLVRREGFMGEGSLSMKIGGRCVKGKGGVMS